MHVVATLAATVVEYFPRSQSVHIATPVFVEYFPGAQSVHATLPIAFLNFPVTQRLHGPPSGPDAPVLQIQPVNAEHVTQEEPEFAGHARQATVAATVVENVLAPQSVHATLPITFLYFPATQAVHTPPSGPVKPALHTQAARAELAVGELELVGQAIQVVLTVAPTVVE